MYKANANPMKINYISCVSGMCGVARYLEELASSVYREGNEVTLYRKWGGGRSFVKKYAHRSFKWLRNYIAPYYLSKAIQEEGAQIWHSDYVDGATALMWAGKANKKDKIVITAHDAIPFVFSASQQFLPFHYYQYHMKNTAKIADAVIVVSEYAKRDLLKHTNISEDRVHVVYNGINHDFFYPNEDYRPDRERNEVFTIRYTGGLGSHHKNSSALIETARVLEERGIQFRMEIGSGNAEATELPALVKKYKLKNVFFKGFIPTNELRAFLAGADVFLFPSLYEGFGFPPLEAMACGTAVVASDRSALPEVLGQAAYLASPSPNKLADAIEDLMTSPYKLKLLRKRGVDKAAMYTWKRTSRRTMEIYNALQ